MKPQQHQGIEGLLNLPSPLDSVFKNTEDLPLFFDNLMYGMVELLRCDRCYLYIRDPQLQTYQIPHCYCVHPEIPNLVQTRSDTESYYRQESDPLFAAAMSGAPHIYIEDTEKLFYSNDNCAFWQQNYLEHKALIQAHIFIDGELWGIIQAAQYDRSRPWTKFDRGLISQIVDKITPLVVVYVKRQLRGNVQYLHDGDR